MRVLTDVQWAVLAPLIEECRPKGKTQHHDLRRTIEAIVWRHRNGARWRAIPAELGPWWMAAQTFIRWAKLGVWGRLLARAQEGGVALGMTFLDGTTIRAHQKAAGAAKKGPMAHSATGVARRIAGRAALGGGRQGLCLARVPSQGVGRRCAPGDPAQSQRGAGRLPRLDLQQPQHGGAALGTVEGMARRRNTI